VARVTAADTLCQGRGSRSARRADGDPDPHLL